MVVEGYRQASISSMALEYFADRKQTNKGMFYVPSNLGECLILPTRYLSFTPQEH
ncbi:hypothetical protein BDZ85DRAFT_268969 [Elsinoe ampelina]|uniref:Uncharacterized protein n=1 Tax=Elsinoe ampelina TaxID=302913 RepID=A0A6A6G0L0_9PEZI|nr:hypothetical protein BDZ85DRAFT_268969 [Elsinoe ampelina]